VAAILLRANRFADALNNPQVFIDLAATLIERAKKQLLVFGDGSAESGVRYLKLANSHYEMRLFENDDLRTVFASNLVAVKNTDKTLFSHIEIDGNSTPERRFAEACESNEDVLFYLKLPRWFVIDTPVGSYNPDWALMYQNDEKLYFVAETKGTSKDGELKAELLRPIEEYKIECGKRHFRQFDGVQFKAVTGLEQLLR
jgi:type III restriction enzyme